MKKDELRYLQRLAEIYPTIGKASTEIINLQSILNLPKGTEHFMSDLHGEYQAFSHVLRNGSGAVRKKIDDCPDLVCILDSSGNLHRSESFYDSQTPQHFIYRAYSAVLYCFQSCTAHNPASVLCPVSYDGSQPEQKCQTSAGEPFSFPSTGKIRESLHGH